ncbi:hypothetical protein ACFXO9_30930 [Nocardia tengchongensis]|uniref:hypothetical protein n=1 Tax=Nocardia tengchongensis TaxID=2055889 RepID=UPI0036C39B52
MLIDSSRCRTFEYALTRPSPCAVGIDPAVVGRANRFSDCLAVSIELEHGDCGLGAVAAKVIRRVADRTGATHIVIHGFIRPPAAHERARFRIDPLTELADALDLLGEIAERLTQSGQSVQLMPFGWYTDIRSDLPESDQGRHSIHLHGGADPSRRLVAGLDHPTIRQFRREAERTATPFSA